MRFLFLLFIFGLLKTQIIYVNFKLIIIWCQIVRSLTFIVIIEYIWIALEQFKCQTIIVFVILLDKVQQAQHRYNVSDTSIKSLKPQYTEYCKESFCSSSLLHIVIIIVHFTFHIIYCRIIRIMTQAHMTQVQCTARYTLRIT